MHSSALFFVVLASTVFASPTAIAPNSGVSQLATFEETDGVGILPELSPIGSYQDLEYTGFDVAKLGIDENILIGILPNSGSYIAASSITTDIRELSVIAVIRPTSPYNTMTLDSLYFGCVADTVLPFASIPVPCVISLEGYLPGETQSTGTLLRTFSPAGSFKTKMQVADKLTGMVKVERVEIKLQTAKGLLEGVRVAITAMGIDDVKYTVYE